VKSIGRCYWTGRYKIEDDGGRTAGSASVAAPIVTFSRVLQLRVFADPATADDVVSILVRADGVRHVERSDPVDASLETLVTADLDAETADAALAAVAAAGVPRHDVYLVRFDAITPPPRSASRSPSRRSPRSRTSRSRWSPTTTRTRGAHSVCS
jgi:hypothetical protein